MSVTGVISDESNCYLFDGEVVPLTVMEFLYSVARPAYNHTREDSAMMPCPECEAQSIMLGHLRVRTGHPEHDGERRTVASYFNARIHEAGQQLRGVQSMTITTQPHGLLVVG